MTEVKQDNSNEEESQKNSTSFSLNRDLILIPPSELSNKCFGSDFKLDHLKNSMNNNELTEAEKKRLAGLISNIGIFTAKFAAFIIIAVDEVLKKAAQKIDPAPNTHESEDLKIFKAIARYLGMKDEDAKNLYLELTSQNAEKDNPAHKLIIEAVKNKKFSFSDSISLIYEFKRSRHFYETYKSSLDEFEKTLTYLSNELSAIYKNHQENRAVFEISKLARVWKSQQEEKIKVAATATDFTHAYWKKRLKDLTPSTLDPENNSYLFVAMELIGEISLLENEILSLKPIPFYRGSGSYSEFTRLHELEELTDRKRTQLKYFLSMHSYGCNN